VDEFRAQLNRRFRRAGMTGEDATTDTVARFQHRDPQTPLAERLGASQPGNPGSYHYDIGTLVGHGDDKILADFPWGKRIAEFSGLMRSCVGGNR